MAEKYKHRIGKVIGGYEILEKLGKGAFSEVYKVLNPVSKEISVLKIMIPHQEGATVLSPLQNEIKVLKNISHDHIVRYIEANQLPNGGDLYILLDYVEGETVDVRLKKQMGSVPLMPLDEIRKAILDLLDALAYLHGQPNPIIHRDINPRNLILNPQRGLVIIDFNVSRIINPGETLKTIVGTPPYIPPEIWNSGQWTPISDLYAVGILMYHMITGHAEAFDSSDDRLRGARPHDPREHCPILSPDIADIVLKAIAYKPEDRYQSANEMRDVILKNWTDINGDVSISTEVGVRKSQTESLEPEIYEKLEVIRIRLVDTSPQFWNTVSDLKDDITTARNMIREVSSPDSISLLNERIDSLDSQLDERCIDQIQKLVSSLENVDLVYEKEENDKEAIKKLYGLISTSNIPGELAARKEHAFDRFDVLKLVLESEELAEKQIDKINKDEAAGRSGGALVTPALALREQVISNYSNAIDKKAANAPELLQRLHNVVERCEKYYQRVRSAHEELTTLEQGAQFDREYQIMSAIRDEEGEQARVTYYNSVETDRATLVTLAEAMPILVLRWSAQLNPRIEKHLGTAEANLTDSYSDPRMAQRELREVENDLQAIDPEIQANLINVENQKKLKQLLSKVQEELSSLVEFERESERCASLTNLFSAWAELERLTQENKYARFHKSSSKWQQTLQAVKDKVHGYARKEITSSCTEIYSHRIEPAQKRVDSLQKSLLPYQKTFLQEYNVCKDLVKITDSLVKQTTIIQEQIKQGNFSTADKTLDQLKSTLAGEIKKLVDFLSPPIKEPEKWKEQAELMRLSTLLAAHKNAKSFLDTQSKQAKETQKPSELDQIRNLLNASKSIIPATFAEEYEKLVAYVTARYSFYAAEAITIANGDPEKALPLYQTALADPEFSDLSEKAIEEISKRRIPSNQRIDQVLKELAILEKDHNWWDVYQKAKKALNSEQHADQAHKRILQVKIGTSQEEALQASRLALQEAIEAGRGNPETMRTHLKQVDELDREQTAISNTDRVRVWVVVHHLEAKNYVQRSDWQRAGVSLREAAKSWSELKGPDSPESRELSNQALAVDKEELLRQCLVLPPKLLYEQLISRMATDFQTDPDLLLEIANVQIKLAEDIQENWIQQELTDHEKSLGNLKTAGNQIARAKEEAGYWFISEKLPAYELARLALLGSGLEEIGNRRNEHIHTVDNKLKLLLIIVQRKVKILHLMRQSWEDVDLPGDKREKYNLMRLKRAIEEALLSGSSRELRQKHRQEFKAWWENEKEKNIQLLEARADACRMDEIGDRLFFGLGIYLLDDTRQTGKNAFHVDLDDYLTGIVQQINDEHRPSKLNGHGRFPEPAYRILILQIGFLRSLFEDIRKLNSALSMLDYVSSPVHQNLELVRKQLKESRGRLEKLINSLEQLNSIIKDICDLLPVAYRENIQWEIIYNKISGWEDNDNHRPWIPENLKTHITLSWISKCIDDLKERRKNLERDKKRIIATLYYELFPQTSLKTASTLETRIPINDNFEDLDIGSEFWESVKKWGKSRTAQEYVDRVILGEEESLLENAVGLLKKMRTDSEPDGYEYDEQILEHKAGWDEHTWKKLSFVEGMYEYLCNEIDDSLSTAHSLPVWSGGRIVHDYMEWMINSEEAEAGSTLDTCVRKLSTSLRNLSTLVKYKPFQNIANQAVVAARKAQFQSALSICEQALIGSTDSESGNHENLQAPRHLAEALQAAEQLKELFDRVASPNEIISRSEVLILARLEPIKKVLQIQKDKIEALKKGVNRVKIEAEALSNQKDSILRKHKTRKFPWLKQKIEQLSSQEMEVFRTLGELCPDDEEYQIKSYMRAFNIGEITPLDKDQWCRKYLPESLWKES